MSLRARQRLFAAIAAAALLIVMVGVSPDFGFTWDERFQQRYGEQIWDYFHGRIPRADFDTDLGNQYLYGGLVEILCVSAQHVFPSLDPYVARHMTIAVFGWAGIVFCGLLAGRAFGARAGWIAAVLLALSPRYFGDAMNNPKDAPFAALSVAVLYGVLTLDARPPHLSWRRVVALAVAIALAINVRPLGLMLLGFAGLVVTAVATWRLVTNRGDEARWRTWALSLARLVPIAIISIPLGTIAWPWAQARPFVRPIQAFFISTRLDWAAGFDVLYGGESVGAGQLPWHYVPLWLLMALPPVVVTGVVASGLAWRGSSRARAVHGALALFAFAPIAAAIWRNATIYDGIRHILFIVPPLTILAAAGWSAMLSTRGAVLRVAALVTLAAGLAEPLIFQVRNHPNQIVYFSPVVGGPRAAFARYDMDYWGNCMLQAVQWADRLAQDVGQPVGVSGNPIQAVQADAGRFHSLFVTPRDRTTFQLDIRLLRGPPDSVREFAARRDVLHTVTTADGAPLCVVLPGPAFGQIAELMAQRY